MYFYYKIPGRPITKKNSEQQAVNKKTGNRFPVQSKAWKKYEKNAKEHLIPMADPIDYPVNVKCTYWIHKNKDGSIPKTPIDLLNLMAGTHDLLVKYKILKDDNIKIVETVDGSNANYTDFTNEEYAEIEISAKANKQSHTGDSKEVPEVQ